MSEIRILIKLEEEPNDDDKQIIESFLISKLAEIEPNAEIKVETKTGSWLILVYAVAEKAGGWLISEFGGWLASQGFDRVQKRLTQAKALPPESEQHNTLPEMTIDNWVPEKSSSGPAGVSTLSQDENIHNLAMQMVNMIENPAFRSSKKVTVRISEWSSLRDLGISAEMTQIKNTENETECEFSVDLTDSQEDFNSRFRL